jgi:hypothetical protein
LRGEFGIWNFLQAIHKYGHGEGKMGIDRFTHFYRTFYKLCPQDCFKPFKILIQEYLNEYRQLPLSRRNNIFDKNTPVSHPWMSLKSGCKEYGIDKSVFRRAKNT